MIASDPATKYSGHLLLSGQGAAAAAGLLAGLLAGFLAIARGNCTYRGTDGFERNEGVSWSVNTQRCVVNWWSGR